MRFSVNYILYSSYQCVCAYVSVRWWEKVQDEIRDSAARESHEHECKVSRFIFLLLLWNIHIMGNLTSYTNSAKKDKQLECMFLLKLTDCLKEYSTKYPCFGCKTPWRGIWWHEEMVVYYFVYIKAILWGVRTSTQAQSNKAKNKTSFQLWNFLPVLPFYKKRQHRQKRTSYALHEKKRKTAWQ